MIWLPQPAAPVDFLVWHASPPGRLAEALQRTGAVPRPRTPMRASIQPFSQVSPERITRHLLDYGLPAEIIEWKYFDPQFKPGGERGYVWLKDGEVRGIIGLIPYDLGDKTEVRRCSWTCDWFVASSERNPGIGALLLKEAMTKAGLLTTLGGNEATSRLVPRMATHTVAKAAFLWTRPLRLGGVRGFGRAAKYLPGWAVDKLERVPTGPRGPTSGGTEAAVGVSVESGIAPRPLERSLTSTPDDGRIPRYDLSYLSWQLGRCPVIETSTVWATDPAAATAAVLWRRTGGRQWRLALWGSQGFAPHARAVVAEACRRVYAQGGHSLAVVVAGGDAFLERLFSEAGFRRPDVAYPLYVLGQGADAVPTVDRLSFVDSDLAYRF